jgi:hypothetical protein
MAQIFMADSLTPDEFLAQKQEKMGDELGRLHFDLANKLSLLHLEWNQFQTLFLRADESDLLDRTIPAVALVFRMVLIDSIILHICRLADPAEMRGGKANVTIHRIPPLLTDSKLRKAIDKLCAQAAVAIKPARDYRNRVIAHLDLPTLRDVHPIPLPSITRDSVESSLTILRDILNRVDLELTGASTLYEAGFASGGADRLVEILRRSEQK